MKKILLIITLCLPFLASAQTKIKETDVPRSVLLSLEKTYESYKVKTWYQAPGQYIAEFVTDGQNGRCYFTNLGDWQYSAFPIDLKECPTLMNTYFLNNYPGYRIKSTDYVEEMSGDNYYRMVIVRKGVGSNDCELIFDTRGKLMRSTAPDPDAVKRDFYTHNNPDENYDDNATKAEKEAAQAKSRRKAKRADATEDIPEVERPMPSDVILANFNKRYPESRLKDGPDWYQRGNDQFVAYFTNNQKNEFECVYSSATESLVKTGKILIKDRYPNAIKKYLDEKFFGERYKIEKMVKYEYDSKYRDENGKKPKPYTYVVVSQKINGERVYTRLEFDHTYGFMGLLAAPLDKRDIQNKLDQ